MAQLLHSTRFKSPTTAVSSFDVTIPATAAGATLVCVAGGGATIQAKLGGSGGTNFTKRTSSLSNREVVAQDIIDSGGGNVTVNFLLNGAENIDGVIYEFAAGSLGNFMTGATQSGPGGNSSISIEGRAIVGSITTTGPAVLFTMFTCGDNMSGSAIEGRKFWGLEPLGKQWANEVITNDPSKSLYWSMIGVSDQPSAGTFTAQSSRIAISNEQQSVVWAYEDLSGGVPTYTNPYANAVAAENSLPGSLSTTWFVGGIDGMNTHITGYTDSLSYKPGDIVNFKVDSNNIGFNVEIARLGFYGFESFGARNQAIVSGTPTVQPAPTVNSYGGAECAWSTNASWTIPAAATTGVYAYILRRSDNTSYITQGIFVVNPATVPSAKSNGILLTTADFTWQAYNPWGASGDGGSGTGGFTGRNLYGTAPNLTNTGRAFAVSYDRPLGTVSANSQTFYWDSEGGLVNFLEGNGYDVSYYTMVDIDKNPTIPSKYTTAISQGHSEYWTENCLDAFGQARDDGTNLMFLSSNTALWHVRFDDADTNRRNIICYKDSHDTFGYDGTTKYDPVTYTGTWRDSRVISGGVNNTSRRPESALTGQWFIGNGTFTDRVAVPNTYKDLPVWRNTRVASGGSISFVGASTNNMTTAGTSCVVDQPAGTQLGDMLLITIVFNGNPASFTGNGFRIVFRQVSDATNQTTVLLQGYATIAGATSYGFTWSGPLMTSQACAVYNNAVWEESNSSVLSDTGGGAQHSTASTATNGSDRWAVCVFADINSNGVSKTTSWTAGGGLTSRVQSDNSVAVAGPWASIALMDSNGAVAQGPHQFSATAEFANAHAAAGMMYMSPGTTLYGGTIGAEWDYVKKEEPTTPSNLVMLSQQTVQITGQRANYYGNNYGGSGTLHYGISMYRAASGAYVFNTGSWQFQWGISRMRAGSFDVNGPVDVAMQQAIINILKDFGHDATTLLSIAANDNTTALIDPGAAATPSDYGFDIAPVAYQSLFDASTVPQTENNLDGSDYSLGTLFTADADGTIHGARWYFPDSLPDLPVVATLYEWTDNTTGNSLGTLTFNDCQQGWNEALFASPIAITPNTRYVISVWTSDHYVTTAGEFSSAAITSGNLTAPQDTVGAHNGKFVAASGSPAYPSNSTGGYGYFADVLYESAGTLSFEGWGIPIS